jgi:hypothetical protein
VVRDCAAIDPAAYQTGLLFNPDGYRSFYVRSACFQRAAIEFRDEALCERVKRRRAWFSSSWGYSKRQCRKAVREGIAADEAELVERRQRYQSGPLRLVDFAVEPNGNGRDYDIVPVFSGADANGYRLRFELIAAGAHGEPVAIHSDRYFLRGDSRLRVFVRRDEIRAHALHFEPGRRYAVRATLVREVGSGSPGGRWSDAFVERVFPERERSQSLERDARF